MLSLNTEINSVLFQPWQPDTASEQPPIPTVAQQPEYIELPGVHCYEELETHAAFPEIKTRFLNDIEEMKQLVQPYVNHQYDTSIDIFHEKLESPPEHLKNSLLALYRETRFQIRQLVMQLRDQQHDPNVDNQNYIAGILHDCLSDIQECAPGIHGRFTQSFLNLDAYRGGLGGKLFTVRSELFDQFIQSFLLELQRERLVDIPPDVEARWKRSLHNLFCEPLGLPHFVDPLAPTHLGDDLTRRFLAAAPLSVNACTILRKLSSGWSDQLSATLQKLGVQTWETDVIAPFELTSERTGTLESTLFKPVNHLLQTSGEQALDLRTVIEETGDGNYYLGRYREKLLAWVASHFCKSSAQVFATIPAGVDSAWHIGTINQLFFWVFNNDQYLPTGLSCTFDGNNHTTLTLPHLMSIDFSTWPETTIYALLTQAMEQTDKARHIASFFLQHTTIEQLDKIPAMVTRALANQLSDKLIKHDDTFKETLYQCVVGHFASVTTFMTPGITPGIAPRVLDWLIDTPLLKPVLLRLQQQGIDVLSITSRLASWQVSDFSHGDMKKLLTPHDCQRLFKQALILRQSETLSNLLLTGHCDPLTSFLSDDLNTPLACFASSGNLAGLEYLLKPGNPQVSQKNIHGSTPLLIAAKNGHAAFVRALLAIDGIDVNAKNNNGFTPLHCAALKGDEECVTELLNTTGIDINVKNNVGYTPLHYAALEGHAVCVRALLTVGGIDVNVQIVGGYTPLYCAVTRGQTECIKELLSADGIDVNMKSSSGFTPLRCAVVEGLPECIKALLSSDDIDVNAKSSSGFALLHWAVSNGQVESILALLTDDRIDVNVATDEGWTPLGLAAQFGHIDCIMVLLNAKGIDVNMALFEGFTALHWAALSGNAECVEVLLNAKGIDVNVKTTKGFTPLHCAAQFGQPGCIKALLKAPDINISIKSNCGLTPLDAARKNGHAECERLLMPLFPDPGLGSGN
ncbi:ankyrin repeat domain-containing protein [Endozoicomonas sp. GU-1]|uniref:ankyrin repeat domain-containing protein n=1 Tax=Endozoicomonas sp. GU-1 TaxID=3009078 RepID=UPI0022B31D5C|nr:ankyrin repeat domain-containing protein [Endozoicomonas sp. GU-1]WBA82661.1 ankyrin repeat domain-containing protein [Endozoicomonas sp. GU-1]WBA85590.1 ankyrin repeat domain-containing protein [Endozoicomonas sp. GU-1]